MNNSTKKKGRGRPRLSSTMTPDEIIKHKKNLNKKKSKKYYQNNKNKVKATQKKYYEKNNIKLNNLKNYYKKQNKLELFYERHGHRLNN